MRIVAAFLLCLSLAACVSSPAQRDPLKQKVSVSVSGPTMPVTRDTPLSWYSDVISINDTAGQTTSPSASQAASGAIPQWLKGEVQRQMQARGFLFSEQETRYQVISVLLLGEGEVSQSTQAMFRLFPSLAGSSKDHPKGTLLLGILDTETRKGVWRSALQTYVMTEASEEERQARVGAAVADTLKGLEPGR